MKEQEYYFGLMECHRLDWIEFECVDSLARYQAMLDNMMQSIFGWTYPILSGESRSRK